MTEQKPTPEEQNLPAAPDSEKTRPDSVDKNTSKATGFFNRVQQVLSEPEPVHPSEAKEIVVDD